MKNVRFYYYSFETIALTEDYLCTLFINGEVYKKVGSMCLAIGPAKTAYHYRCFNSFMQPIPQRYDELIDAFILALNV